MSLPTSWEELVSAIDPPRGSLASLALAKAPDWSVPIPEFARLVTPATRAKLGSGENLWDDLSRHSFGETPSWQAEHLVELTLPPLPTQLSEPVR